LPISQYFDEFSNAAKRFLYMTVTASFPVSSPTVDDVYKRHHYLNTAVTIVDPMTPVLDCTHLVEIHLCSGFCEFICHGPLHE